VPVVIGIVGFVVALAAAKRIWNAGPGVSIVLSGTFAAALGFFSQSYAYAEPINVLIVGVVGVGAGWFVSTGSGRNRFVAAFGSVIVLGLVSYLMAARDGGQPWTNFMIAGLVGLVAAWGATEFIEDGGAALGIGGPTFIVVMAMLFQTEFRDKLVDTLQSVVIAIVASAVVFIGANRWFDQARNRWSLFGALTGGILMALLFLVLDANRFLRWELGGENQSSMLWLLGLVVGSGIGWWMATATGSLKSVAAFVGPTALLLLIGAFLPASSLPDINWGTAVLWAIGSAAAAAALSFISPSWLRLLVAFGVVALATRLLSEGVVVDGLSMGFLAVLVTAAAGSKLRQASATGAVFGWLFGAFGFASYGSGPVSGALLALGVLGLLIGSRIALNHAPTAVRRDALTLKSRAIIFLTPALMFISGALVFPVLRTLYLSFLDDRGEGAVGFANYLAIVRDDGILDFSGWRGIPDSGFYFWGGLILVAGAIVSGFVSGSRRGHVFERNGGVTGGTVIGLFLLSFAVFAGLRGTIFNNIWWVITVTAISTGAGLAIAVLADGAKLETVAKSIIFMPMAVSFVGASIIWRFMYSQRNATKPQTGVLNALWVWFGKASFNNNRYWLAGIAALVVAGLLFLAWRGLRANAGTLMLGSLGISVPLLYFMYRILGPGLGGFAVDEAGEAVFLPTGELVAQPIDFITQGPWNNFWLMVVLIWIQTGFTMVILSAAIKAVPGELIEAAQVDGATESQTFWKITVPQIVPTIGVVTTTLVVLVMKVFDIVKVMTNGNFDTQVLANEMFQRAIVEFNLGLGSALAMVLFIAVLPVMYINIRRMQGENA